MHRDFLSFNAPSGGVAQLVRALPCHGRGYGFEPRRSRHLPTKVPTILGTRARRKTETMQWSDGDALVQKQDFHGYASTKALPNSQPDPAPLRENGPFLYS